MGLHVGNGNGSGNGNGNAATSYVNYLFFFSLSLSFCVYQLERKKERLLVFFFDFWDLYVNLTY